MSVPATINAPNCMTLVGFPKVIGAKGNCFSAIVDDKSNLDMWVANIGLESLEACRVPWPIAGRIWRGLFFVTDKRIPRNAYRSKLCACMRKGLSHE